MVNRISFKNYKLFRERQILDIVPITILIGKNNSGKSAIAKLPTMISGSLEGDFSAPFQLENDGVRVGQTYEDLFYNREITGAPIEFDIVDNNSNVSVLITGDRTYNVRVSKLSIDGETINLVNNKLNGMLPKGRDPKKVSLNFDYIESFRKFPAPTFSDIFGEYKKLGVSGENAYKLLAQYHHNGDGIVQAISDWFEQNFEGWRIKVKDITGTSLSFEVVLENTFIKPINIVNTGSGIRQSLPLIVRSFMPVNDDILIIIEEPETHLHPAAHGNLAERFVDSYIDDKRRKYLIETHSENFILRIQRLIASRKISVDDVAIYYIDYNEQEGHSTLRRLNIEPDGEIEDWPDNIFNEGLDEVLKFRKAQKENQNASTNS
ncbi:AAA family ATPase [Dyadobacter sp. OTU695]|uniref:AAA family ATPase n=1 Tax=Dyadobacter sp. OTU695 TaxID=3043860 RepID=UPI00313B414F